MNFAVDNDITFYPVVFKAYAPIHRSFIDAGPSFTACPFTFMHDGGNVD
jgi:hypothetical protein